MKPKEKRLIAILVAITLVVLVIFFVTRGNRGTSSKAKSNTSDVPLVTVLSDGTRKNTSSKIAEPKEFDGMEISGIQLTEKDNITLILGTITNKTNEQKGGYSIKITLVDENGAEIKTVEAYIKPLEPNEATQLSTNGTFDGANAYDLKISK